MIADQDVCRATATCRADVVTIVRRVLRKAARQTEGLHLRKSDYKILDLAAEASAVVLICEAMLRRGEPLTTPLQQAYSAAYDKAEVCFTALGLENPYGRRPNA
jgi:hypothetical protein